MSGRAWELIGGNLALDFVNSAGGLRGINAREYLPDYGELVDWSRAAGLVNPDEASILVALSNERGEEAESVRLRGIALREAIHNIAMALMHGDRPAECDLDILNSELAQAPEVRRLLWGSDGFEEGVAVAPVALDRMLGPIARAAYGLFTSTAVNKIRMCGSDTCGWLFLDTTKNRSRRWCEMKSCGNLAKVRQFRARKSADRLTPADS